MKKSIKSSNIVAAIITVLLIALFCVIAIGIGKYQLFKGDETNSNCDELKSSIKLFSGDEMAEVISGFASVENTLEYICPYEDSKCIVTSEFDDGNGAAEILDVYVYIYDNVVGTWIVNQEGQKIDLYGKMYICHTSQRVYVGAYYWENPKCYVCEPDIYV